MPWKNWLTYMMLILNTWQDIEHTEHKVGSNKCPVEKKYFKYFIGCVKSFQK